MADLQKIKQRFGIIGHNPLLDRAIDIALQVAPTELSVLVTGESGVGKETMPQIIHNYSNRKHNNYIAVNCGAIPEGTIDSELFGHEKGAFTGATDSRKGYFEVADGGTIFLDEVAELPLQTQVRLLRVLETGEYIRVGSSKVQKTDVRIVAATNVNIPEAIRKGRFREDLFYRLNTVPVYIPPLRQRKEDIHLIFRKFASDFSEKYRMPVLRLTPDAVQLLENYRWPGNIRQLKNVTEQISVIEQDREISANSLRLYLPDESMNTLPALAETGAVNQADLSEREILYKILFDLKKDVTEMKKVIAGLMQGGVPTSLEHSAFVKEIIADDTPGAGLVPVSPMQISRPQGSEFTKVGYHQDIPHTVEVEESLSLEEKEMEMIKKALKKHRGKRKYAAIELGISERTLYRKIKEFNIDE
jgi:transcriptional regulator with PAS, ATPase and Fis domain